MIHFFTTLAHTLRHSILARLGLAMGTLALLSFISILISAIIAESSSGKASAINLSGSMRMMSFRLLSEVQQPEKRAQVPRTMEDYEHRLNNLDNIITLRLKDNPALAESMATVVEEWRSLIRPLIETASTGNPDALTETARAIPYFVDRIDRVVLLIEEDLERRIRLLRATQIALLGIVIVLSLLTSWMLRQLLVSPLAELLKAARTVSGGAFTARVSHVGQDELGQLGLAFNTMIEEIASMYAHLEVKVEERTQELRQAKETLELLYRTSQQLSASELSLETIQKVLNDTEQELELGHSMICIREEAGRPARPVLGNLSADENRQLCGAQDCDGCMQQARLPLAEQARVHADTPHPIMLPIGDGKPLQGALPVFIKPGHPLSPEKLRTLKTVGLHISNALSTMQRTEEKHRLAVLEERAVIARELHDSIAQSLSYLKIQVTRLEHYVTTQPEAQIIVQELRSGLNAAYKELRELITFFRLRLDERGLNIALQETIEEFSGKLGFTVELTNTLAGIVLSGNEEMHVIRIIREALVNIEKHAGASQASVAITIAPDRSVSICINDNGRGFNLNNIPPNHYGMSIMEDRTQSLGGRLHIDTAPGKGTCIQVEFIPEKNQSTPEAPGA